MLAVFCFVFLVVFFYLLTLAIACGSLLPHCLCYCIAVVDWGMQHTCKSYTRIRWDDGSCEVPGTPCAWNSQCCGMRCTGPPGLKTCALARVSAEYGDCDIILVHGPGIPQLHVTPRALGAMLCAVTMLVGC